MKRYLVFTGYQYYPSGGWSDFQTSCDSFENAVGYIASHSNYDWWQIVDHDTGKIVEATG